MQNIYACFVAYAKAFDKVKHENLTQILRQLNFDDKDVRLVTNLCQDQTVIT